MNKIESNRKIISVIEQINKRGGELTFVKFQNDIFENNLKLIDSSLPIILGEMIKLYFRTYQISINKLVKTLSEKNPLNYEKNIDYAFYENKIKRFLVDTSFGMSPSIAWNGIYDDTWGYLSIKENGEIQSYPGYLLKSYADYLFNNTKLETASSTRHAFGTIYKESDNYFIKLNLQIRFN